MSKKTTSGALLWLVIALVASAIATLLPVSTVHNPNLGYASWCPFAPFSTIFLLLAAGILWVVRQYVQTRLK